MKQVAFVVGMFFLGFSAFTGLQALFEWRMDKPVEPERLAAGEAEGDLARIVVQGVHAALEHAHRALVEGRRSRAVHAIDAARRATDVAKHSFGNPRENPFDDVLRAIHHARHALQMGEPKRAEKKLKEAMELALLLEPTGERFRRHEPRPEERSEYEGAKVIDPQGVMRGEVMELHIDERPATAVVSTGGVHDVMGVDFFDLGGRRHRVPLDVLIFGKRRTLGGTFVMLPDVAHPEVPMLGAR